MAATSARNYWIKSGFLTILQNLSGVLFGFGGFYLLVRLLSKHDFGAWTLFMSTVTILEFARNGLVGNALVKYLSSSEHNEHGDIISASMGINLVVTALCVIINLVFAKFLSTLWETPELMNMFYLFNFVYIITGILSIFNCIETANLNYKGIFITTVLRQGIFFGYLGAVFLFGWKISLISLVVVQIISAGGATLCGWLYVRKYWHYTKKVSREWVRSLLNYGKYAFGTTVSSILSSNVDQMMLGALLSPMASGAFNVAVRITNLVDIPTNSLAAIVFPQSARRMATEGPEAVKYLYEKSVGTILAMVIPFLLIMLIFTELIVSLVAGGKYTDTVPLLRVTVFYCMFVPFGRQCGTVLDSIGKTKTNFIMVIITAVTNLGLNFVFIKSFGVIGAAYATLTSNILGFIMGQIVLNRTLNINPFNAFIYAFYFYPEFLKKYLFRPWKNE